MVRKFRTLASYNEAAQGGPGFIAQEVEKAADESGYNFSGIVTPKMKKNITASVTNHCSATRESSTGKAEGDRRTEKKISDFKKAVNEKAKGNN